MSKNLDYPWSICDHLQTLIRDYPRVDSRAWGIENGLDYLLAVIAKGAVPADPAELEAAVDRAIATGARRHRHRRVILASLPVSDEAATDERAHVCLEVRRIARLVSSNEAVFLIDAGMGYTDREVAERRGGTPGAARARLARLRLKIAA